MAKEMEQAALIQQRLLPSAAPGVEGLDIAGKTVACRTVGGDYYDFLTFPDGKVGMLVGDVAGKGMPASLLMSSLQARVHVLFEESTDLARKVSRLNKTTCKVEELAGGGIILGITPMAAYQESQASLDPGDVLVLFSDGVTEASDPNGQEFGEGRLADLVASLRGR